MLERFVLCKSSSLLGCVGVGNCQIIKDKRFMLGPGKQVRVYCPNLHRTVGPKARVEVLLSRKPSNSGAPSF